MVTSRNSCGTWPFQAGAKLRDLHSQVDPTLNGWKKECSIAHDVEEAQDEGDLFSLDDEDEDLVRFLAG